jgi:hypothetical protein
MESLIGVVMENRALIDRLEGRIGQLEDQLGTVSGQAGALGEQVGRLEGQAGRLEGLVEAALAKSTGVEEHWQRLVDELDKGDIELLPDGTTICPLLYL